MLGWAVLLSTAPCVVFAESAPVFDATDSTVATDNGGEGLDESVDQTQDLPPPPPPGQEAAVAKSYGLHNSNSIDQRLKRLEQRLNNPENNVTSAQVDSLQHQVQTLRGEVEQLTHQLQQLQTQQQTQQAQLKKFYVDIDQRLSNLKNTTLENKAHSSAKSKDKTLAGSSSLASPDSADA